jgi:hypothetical protein
MIKASAARRSLRVRLSEGPPLPHGDKPCWHQIFSADDARSIGPQRYRQTNESDDHLCRVACPFKVTISIGL